jgi:hypothetical protein
MTMLSDMMVMLRRRLSTRDNKGGVGFGRRLLLHFPGACFRLGAPAVRCNAGKNVSLG